MTAEEEQAAVERFWQIIADRGWATMGVGDGTIVFGVTQDGITLLKERLARTGADLFRLNSLTGKAALLSAAHLDEIRAKAAGAPQVLVMIDPRGPGPLRIADYDEERRRTN